MDFASLTYPEVAVLWMSHFQRPYNCLGYSHETYLRHWLIKGICKVFWGKTHEELCSALCKPADIWTLVAKPLSTGGNRCICPACTGFASALGQICASFAVGLVQLAHLVWYIRIFPTWFPPPRSCLDTFALVFFRHHSDDLHSDVLR